MRSCSTDAVRKINIAETNRHLDLVFKPTESLNEPFKIYGSETNAVNNATKTSVEEIPRLFPPNTPGQDRLNRLRNSLNPQNENNTINNESTRHALNIIHNEFGLCNDNNVHPTLGEDEPMDWEPCDIFKSIENTVYKDFVNISFIVPDTNVFLDDISCIRNTIHRG